MDQANAVNGGIEAAYKEMKPGGSWLAAYQASRDFIVEAGFGDLHSPFLGHGIGVKLHESVPMMHDQVDPDAKFEKGNYCSVEPGLYIEKMGALRFERNVAVMDDGVDVFDEFPCHL